MMELDKEICANFTFLKNYFDVDLELPKNYHDVYKKEILNDMLENLIMCIKIRTSYQKDVNIDEVIINNTIALLKFINVNNIKENTDKTIFDEDVYKYSPLLDIFRVIVSLIILVYMTWIMYDYLECK